MADRTETARRIEIMQAFVDEKADIEACNKGTKLWYSTDDSPSWNWTDCDFRVKPKSRVWWVNVYPDYATTKLHPSQTAADCYAVKDRIECVKVREVLE